MRLTGLFGLQVGLLAIASLAAGAAPAAALDDGVSGEWKIVFEVGGNTREYVLELSQAGEAVKGTMVSPRSKNRYPVEEGTFRESALKIAVRHSEGVLRISAKLAGDDLQGTIESPLGAGTCKGKREKARPGTKPVPGASLAGVWKVVAKVEGGDREMPGKLEVLEKEGKLSGKLSNDRGSLDLRKVEVAEGGKVLLSFNMEREGAEYTVDLEGAFESPQELKGRWKTADGTYSGVWSAKKEAPPAPPAAPKEPKAAAEPLRPRYVLQVEIPGEAPLRAFLEARVEGEKLLGAIVLGGRKAEFRSGSWKGGRLEAEVVVQWRGEEYTVKIAGSIREKGRLQGTYSTESETGEWTGWPAAEL